MTKDRPHTTEEFNQWIEDAKGIAQEAKFALERIKIRAIPSSTNEQDYQLVRHALWRLDRLDRQS